MVSPTQLSLREMRGRRKYENICMLCLKKFSPHRRENKFCSSYQLRRGIEAEHMCAQVWHEAGYHVMLTKASRGFFDVCAFNDRETVFIQVKRTANYYRRLQKKHINELAKVRVSKKARKELWSFLENYGWFTKQVA